MKESNSKTKENWGRFILKEIEIEKDKTRIYGLTIWGLLVGFAIVGDRLIESLYMIDSTQNNISLMINLISTVLVLLLNITSFLFCKYRLARPRIVNYRNKNTEFNNMNLFFLIGIIHVIIYSILPIIMELPYMKIWLLLLLNFDIIIVVFIWLVTSHPIEFDYFYEKENDILDIIVVFIYKHLYFFYTLKILTTGSIALILIKNLNLDLFSKDMIILCLLIIVKVIIVLFLTYAITKILKESFYTDLRRESFLSDINEKQIENIIIDSFIGVSSIRDIDLKILKTEELTERIINNVGSMNYLDDEINNLIGNIDNLRDSLDDYFDCKKSLISYLEIEKRYEWSKRLEKLRLKLKSVTVAEETMPDNKL